MMKESFHIFSHRGAAHIYPENTIPAFKEAVRQGATGIELDVQLSKDNCPIVIHDEYLTRTTNGRGLVKNHTVMELKKLSAGAWLHPRFRWIKIPTLDEVLVKAKTYPIYINIEMKNLLFPVSDLEKEVIKVIYKHEMADRVILSSFNPESLKRTRSIDSTLMTGFLYFGRLERPWRRAYELGAAFLHPPINSLTKELVRRSHRRGLLVCPYHVNTKNEILYALSCHVDGIITRYPEKAKKLLNEVE